MNDDQIAKNLSDNPDKWWTHEGDWEGISIHFMDYETSSPTEVIFSQHHDPKKRLWKNVQIQDDRILTIPAIGSHAIFFEPIRKRHLMKRGKHFKLRADIKS